MHFFFLQKRTFFWSVSRCAQVGTPHYWRPVSISPHITLSGVLEISLRNVRQKWLPELAHHAPGDLIMPLTLNDYLNIAFCRRPDNFGRMQGNQRLVGICGRIKGSDAIRSFS